MHTKTQIPCTTEVLYSRAQSTLHTFQKKITNHNPDAISKTHYLELQNIYKSATKSNIKKQRCSDILNSRNNLLEKSYDCRMRWNLLKHYIILTYPAHIHSILLKLIGEHKYEVNTVNEWQELKKMFTLGWKFLKENEKEIIKSNILPIDFAKKYKLSYNAFLKALKVFQDKTEENKSVFSENKIYNQKLYDALEKIMNGADLH